jgi:hypothetical protein
MVSGCHYFLLSTRDDYISRDGWNSLKGTPKEVCYEKYVELFIKVIS